jgi:hydroxymethylpyrimidine pyrophosphatase-like HAD family hydrolase
MQLVMNPYQYDMLVLPNLYGDIVSDLCAAFVGGLGLVPSANLGESCAIFEAVHGSAPDIAGQDKANPTAMLQSAILMLHHIDEAAAANKIQAALDKVYAEKTMLTRVGFDPTLVADFEGVIDRLDKLVAVSDQPDLLADVERAAQRALKGLANARRSQTYYLDVTHPDADKGHAVRALCAEIGVPRAETAVIGDQANDIAMFRVAGLSIAMGQGTDEVKASADLVTDANTAEGFAHAVGRFVLPRAGQSAG